MFSKTKFILFLISSLVSFFLVYNHLAGRQGEFLGIKSTASVKVLAQNIPLTPSSTSSPTPTSTLTPTPTLSPTPTVTNTPTPTPIIIAPAELEQLFEKYSQQYSVAKDLLKRIARCESGFNPSAVNRDYGGLYQFTQSLWVSTRQLMGQDSDVNLRFNPEEAIKTASFMISQGHLGIWPICGK